MPARRIASLLLLSFALLFTACKTPQTSSTDASFSAAAIQKQIDKLLSQNHENTRLGIRIVSVDSGDLVYERNPAQTFIPASTLKLFTAAAALHYLGPSFRFRTPVLVERKKGEINHVYIQGSGDPSFSTQDLDTIADTFRQYNVKRIVGDLVIDDTRFDDNLWGRGWMWDDMQKGYSAPTNALNVNYNRLVVYANPGESKGDPLSVRIDPFTRYVKLSNQGTTANADPLVIKVRNPNDKGLSEGQLIEVTGALTPNAGQDYESFAVQDPSLFAGYLLKEALQQKGIAFKGQIRRGATRAEATLFTTIVSRPLGEALIDFVKISNNQPMETLLKAIALQRTSNLPASFEAGLEAVRSFLKNETKISTRGLVVADASGLSRYSQTTPAQMTGFLSAMWNNFRIGPEFVSSLPIGGEDGTLGKRWKNSELQGRVRAKTGSMANVSCLVGYVTHQSGEVFAFAILINSSANTRSVDRALVDQILSLML